MIMSELQSLTAADVAYDPASNSMTYSRPAVVLETVHVPIITVRSTLGPVEQIYRKHGGAKYVGGEPRYEKDELGNAEYPIRSKETVQRITLFEKSPLHPGGEICISDQQPHRVALTERVQALIDKGELEIVSE
jgi:hypothetical protein